ncbi:MAG: Asp23/Gls24 family envelope stress response protein [Oscillospiraceae bacterium]
MIKIENPLGVIDITEEYFSQLIGSVVPSCYGVVGMSNSNSLQGIRSLLYRNKKYVDQGVTVHNEVDGLIVDLHIIVTYGVNIATIVESIIHKVRYTVEEATQLKVKNVNVFVDAMRK